jgi:hypothetical protein
MAWLVPLSEYCYLENAERSARLQSFDGSSLAGRYTTVAQPAAGERRSPTTRLFLSCDAPADYALLGGRGAAGRCSCAVIIANLLRH